MKVLLTLIDVSGVVLLIFSIILSLKSKTGKSLSQRICLYTGEVLCIIGTILFLQLSV